MPNASKPVRTANCNARRLVQSVTPFKGANTFGEWDGKRYVVYSYGRHWPLFVYCSVQKAWYENSDKYSRTTSKHRIQLHPLAETIKRDRNTLYSFIYTPTETPHYSKGYDVV